MNQDINFPGRIEVEKWIRKLKSDRKKFRTCKKHFGHLKWHLEFVNKKIEDIDFEDIENWKFEMSVVRNYKRSTVRQNLQILKKFYKYNGKDGLSKNIEMPDAKLEDSEEKESMTKEEELEFKKASMKMGIRTESWVKLALSTALRPNEQRNITIDDIDLEAKKIKIRPDVSKTNRHEIVYFNEDTKQALERYIQVRTQSNNSDNDWLFTMENGKQLSYSMILKTVKTCTVKAKITKNITPYCLRHTAITLFHEGIKDIEKTRIFARHKKIATTQIYLHTSDEEFERLYRKNFDTHNPQVNVDNNDILKKISIRFANGDMSREAFELAIRPFLNSENPQKKPGKLPDTEINYA